MPPSTDTPEDPGIPLPSEALLRSYALWGDQPWEAPEVPSPGLLRAWAESRLHHPDLDAQIAASVNCERTLPLLDLLEAEESLLVPEASPVLPAPAPEYGRPDPLPQPGQLWSTRSAVEQRLDGVSATRWTFDPVPVLLVCCPLEFPDGDRVWRAVAVSPSGNWPEFCRVADDVEIHAGAAGHWVAHLWLEYPLSECQLSQMVGRISNDLLSHLAELGAGRPEGDPLEFEDAGASLLSDDALRECDRLMARCAFLPMTADARRASREWMEELWETIDLVPQEALETSCLQVERQVLLPQAGGIAANTSQAVIFRGSAKAFAAALASGSPDLPTATSVDLLLLRDDPSGDTSEPVAQWDLTSLHLAGATNFIVLDPAGRKMLAHGRVRDDIATVTGRFFRSLREARERSSKWLLVVCQPPAGE